MMREISGQLGRAISAASSMALTTVAGTLLALVLALTVGLFGIREQLGGELVVTALVVESIGTVGPAGPKRHP